MKKNLIYILLVTLIVFPSCDPDGFLDREIPSADREFGKPQNLEDISNILFGTYWQMVIGRSETGFAQPTTIYMMWNELASDGFTITDEETIHYQNQLNGYFTYNRERDHLQTTLYERMYSICYTLISNLNQATVLIENPTSELLSDQLEFETDYNQFVGEIYALRAMNYFMLSQVYGVKYIPGGDNSRPALILKTENSADFEDIFGTLSSIQELYDLIISDLSIAAEHISSTKFTGRFNKAAVYGYLSRIYLDMNDWENAHKYANLAIGEGFSFEEQPINAFTHTDESTSSEVIFEFQNSIGHNWIGQRHTEFVSENSPLILSFWNWIERRTMGSREILGKRFTVDNVAMRTYAVSHQIMRKVGWMQNGSTNLTAAANNDLRFQQVFHWAPGNTDTRMEPVTENIPQEDFAWVFKDARSTNDNVLDGNDFTFELYEGRAHLPIIRLGEMYLTRAIASLKMGDSGSALADLNFIKERVWDTEAGAFIPFSGNVEQIEEEIENERIKELLGEGDRLFYLKAMQYDVPGGDRPGAAPISTPYEELFWELPPSEVNNNPNLGG